MGDIGSLWGKIPGFLRNPWNLAMGGGAALDLYAKRRQADAQKEAMDDYLESFEESRQAARWTPEKRKGLMSGVRGIISESVGAEKRRAGAAGAAAGRGGGSYQKRLDKIRRRGRETEARAAAQTYGPEQLPIPGMGAYAARGVDPTAQWLNQLLGVGGRALGVAGGQKLYDKLYRKGGRK